MSNAADMSNKPSSVTLPLSVACRMSATLMHCAQTAEDIDTISFAYVSPPCHFQIVLKFSLHRSTRSSPNFFLEVTQPLLISASETFCGKITAEWLQIAQWSQWRAYRKSPSLFRIVPSRTPTTSTSLKIGPQIHPSRSACIIYNI